MTTSPTKLLFFSTLIAGTLITISSNSWFSAWIGLEINLLSFIPLMTNSKNAMSTEASLKYFLIQALASTSLLFIIILWNLFLPMSMLKNQTVFLILISSTLLLKMGAAPFHFWFPGTMEGLNWMNCLILMTWQKIAPLLLLSYVIKVNLLFASLVILLSISIGSVGGLNQTSLRKLMAYSSINHLGWMIAAMIAGENLWEVYFSIYSFLSISLIFIFQSFQIFHIGQGFLIMNQSATLKFFLFSLLLSLGGLPPFIGFLPKWLVIQSLADLNWTFTVTVMVIMTLLTLFYYLRICFSSFLLSYSEMGWNKTSSYDTPSLLTMMILSTVSSFGLLLSSILFNTF